MYNAERRGVLGCTFPTTKRFPVFKGKSRGQGRCGMFLVTIYAVLSDVDFVAKFAIQVQKHNLFNDGFPGPVHNVILDVFSLLIFLPTWPEMELHKTLLPSYSNSFRSKTFVIFEQDV